MTEPRAITEDECFEMLATAGLQQLAGACMDGMMASHSLSVGEARGHTARVVVGFINDQLDETKAPSHVQALIEGLEGTDIRAQFH